MQHFFNAKLEHECTLESVYRYMTVYLSSLCRDTLILSRSSTDDTLGGSSSPCLENLKRNTLHISITYHQHLSPKTLPPCYNKMTFKKYQTIHVLKKMHLASKQWKRCAILQLLIATCTGGILVQTLSKQQKHCFRLQNEMLRKALTW